MPEALKALEADPPEGLVRAFERTAGDEVQGLLSDPEGVVEAVTRLARLGGWRVGVGVGEVDTPLPESTRAATGPAFVAARRAVEDARTTPAQVAVRGARDGRAVRRADAALVALGALLARRTIPGWEAAALSAKGMTGQQIATRLGISPSAVSQRLRAAAAEEAGRSAWLAADLLGEADG